MVRKQYTSESVQKAFDNKLPSKKVEILEEALSIMEMYNGKTQFECIAQAMGYTPDGKFWNKEPKLEEV